MGSLSAGAICVANAPCSWGALEFEDVKGEQIGYARVLDELRATGYTGTELGDWGYMPTEPTVLAGELARRELALVGAFVPVALRYEERHEIGAQLALKTARLLKAVGEGLRIELPLLVLADENGTDPMRTQNAGRVGPEMGLSADDWRTFARGAERIARLVREETGLGLVFHHHCAGYVETPDEIARFLDLTDPALIGLAFDTGHYFYGTGANEGQAIMEGLARFGERIGHMHFKDCSPQVAEQARRSGWDYFTALRHGVFCELGWGAVPFAGVAEWLRGRGYGGWIVVEQDVLPGMGQPKESAQRNRDYLRSLGL